MQTKNCGLDAQVKRDSKRAKDDTLSNPYERESLSAVCSVLQSGGISLNT